MNNISVIKRGGDKESYDKNKIARVVLAAQLPKEKLQTLLDNVTAWVVSQGNSEISSLAIRDRVIKELTILYKPSADLYKWYQKTKE